jgi:hypothetical protein
MRNVVTAPLLAALACGVAAAAIGKVEWEDLGKVPAGTRFEIVHKETGLTSARLLVVRDEITLELEGEPDSRSDPKVWTFSVPDMSAQDGVTFQLEVTRGADDRNAVVAGLGEAMREIARTIVSQTETEDRRTAWRSRVDKTIPKEWANRDSIRSACEHWAPSLPYWTTLASAEQEFSAMKEALAAIDAAEEGDAPGTFSTAVNGSQDAWKAILGRLADDPAPQAWSRVSAAMKLTSSQGSTLDPKLLIDDRAALRAKLGEIRNEPAGFLAIHTGWATEREAGFGDDIGSKATLLADTIDGVLAAIEDVEKVSGFTPPVPDSVSIVTTRELQRDVERKDRLEVSLFVGEVLNQFSAAERDQKLANPEAEDEDELQFTAGVEVHYRVMEKKKQRLYLFFQAIHSARKFQEACPSTGDSTCDAAAANDPQTAQPDDFFKIVQDSSVLEWLGGARWVFKMIEKGEPKAEVYFKAQPGFIRSSEADGDSLDNYFAGFGVQLDSGPFDGTFAEMGWGRSEMFEEDKVNDRFKLGLALNYQPTRNDRMGFYFEGWADNDLGKGSDDVQIYFGISFDVGRAAGQLLGPDQ